MAYKSVFTVLTSPALAAPTIAAASAMTQTNDGHLDILCLGVDRLQQGYAYIGSGAVALQVGLDRAEADAREVEAAVKRAIEAEEADLRVGIDTLISQTGAITELVSQRARFADLVVLPSPYQETDSPEAEAALESCLFEGQAPVLVVPKNGSINPTPKRVILAWDQSREAMTAARKALPFLKAADVVEIVVVDPPIHGPERSDPGGMLCQMLVRHGVKAEVTVLARSLPRISEVLERHAVDRAADLLVMGGYGHSRLREALLGGATRNMLEHATLPILMAH